MAMELLGDMCVHMSIQFGGCLSWIGAKELVLQEESMYKKDGKSIIAGYPKRPYLNMKTSKLRYGNIEAWGTPTDPDYPWL